jgi:hypothetical protein
VPLHGRELSTAVNDAHTIPAMFVVVAAGTVTTGGIESTLNATAGAGSPATLEADTARTQKV